MNGWEFTAKVIEALAWPIGVVVLVAMLRKEVLQLIPKLTKLEAGPLKAEFSMEAKKVLVEAQEIQLAPLNGEEVNVPHDIPRDDGMYQDPLSIAMWRTAAISPTTAIVDAWKDIEEVLLAIVTSHGVFIPERSTRNVGVWINAIAQKGILPLETLSVIHELRELRNRAAHAGFEPMPEAAQDYLLAAQRLVRVLQSYVTKGV